MIQIIQKSYSNTSLGNFYIVPTPIGNKNDITLRAIEILKSVDFIYAEDTRTTGVLLRLLNINSKLKSCHLYNESEIKFKIVEYLKEGKNIALVSDQGTPLLSDPGYEVVQEIIGNNINVISLPGPNALLPALNMSGIEANKFLFYGFLNSKNSLALKELEELKKMKFTLVFYESPHRLKKTLENIENVLGNRKISIIREISKIHEEIYRGYIKEAIEIYEKIKGEIVIVVEKYESEEIDIDLLLEEIDNEISDGITHKDAIKKVSKKYNVSKNMLYNKTRR